MKTEKISSFCCLPIEDSASSFEKNYLDLDFNVIHRAVGNNRYADDAHKRLLNLGPLAYLNKC